MFVRQTLSQSFFGDLSFLKHSSHFSRHSSHLRQSLPDKHQKTFVFDKRQKMSKDVQRCQKMSKDIRRWCLWQTSKDIFWCLVKDKRLFGPLVVQRYQMMMSKETWVYMKRNPDAGLCCQTSKDIYAGLFCQTQKRSDFDIFDMFLLYVNLFLFVLVSFAVGRSLLTYVLDRRVERAGCVSVGFSCCIHFFLNFSREKIQKKMYTARETYTDTSDASV